MSYTGNIRADWDTAPPATREFWNNLANSQSDQCRPPYTQIGWSFVRYNAYQLYAHNMHYQLTLYGRYDSSRVEFVDNHSFAAPSTSVPLDTHNLVQYFAQYAVIPTTATDYPHAKTRACRHYWTGLSRPRRNL